MALPTAPFDATKSIFAGLSVIQLKLLPQLTTITAATDTLTLNNHGLQNGQLVQFMSGTGFTGLVAGTNYFVSNVAANTFKLSATKGGSAITVGTSSLGIFAPVSVFEAPQLEDDPDQEAKFLDRPDYSGKIRHYRAVEIKAQEKWTFALDEVKRLLEVFSGALRGRKNATATLWIPDPQDATGLVSLKSETDFACSVSRDGKVTFGNSDFSKTTIKIESLKAGDVLWTADGAA